MRSEDRCRYSHAAREPTPAAAAFGLRRASLPRGQGRAVRQDLARRFSLARLLWDATRSRHRSIGAGGQGRHRCAGRPQYHALRLSRLLGRLRRALPRL
ncbi:hypothetical protein BIWAKO_06212 [Bosea sp. BIWAKO-01]|nr:hypothetical protein BIWAKO_06212 [Bosea sp. BIWAKO-01]